MVSNVRFPHDMTYLLHFEGQCPNSVIDYNLVVRWHRNSVDCVPYVVGWLRFDLSMYATYQHRLNVSYFEHIGGCYHPSM